MITAIPVNPDATIVHNAGYAPFFSIYETSGSGAVHLKTVANPRAAMIPSGCLATMDCHCPGEVAGDPQHMILHYYLVEILHGCDMVLVKFLCEHTRRIFDQVGLLTYKIPPIIHDEEHAIRNFILGDYHQSFHGAAL